MSNIDNISPRDAGTAEPVKIFSEYAEFYDILYQDKDYINETNFISSLFEKLLPGSGKELRILDLACGTGKHAMELAKLGYSVDGSDISSEMIRIAKKECSKRKLPIHFYNESFQTAANINAKYDVILSMFASINYLTSYKDLAFALKNIYTLLKDGGIFVFDFWNGDAVVDTYSPVKVKRMVRDNREILRISTTNLDRVLQMASVNFNFLLIEDGKILKDFNELHTIRYYFLQELLDLLSANNFALVFRCPFMDIAGNITPSEWNVTYAVQKIAHI